ncbi:MAG: YdeI/OmpD-associated family protein [candidate division WOR-3 bacterium]
MIVAEQRKKKKFKTLYVTERKEWRKWLEQNYNREKEIWLIYPHKSSGKPRILYNDAVEEALCFGWIDSTVRKFDKESSMQRFSPRNPKSTYSQANKERLRWLLKKDMIHPSLKESVKKILQEKFVFPPDIIKAIKKDKKAWENYQKFSESYKRIRVAYIEGARKRPEEFNKRLSNFINKTRNNKLIGFGGIEKHY